MDEDDADNGKEWACAWSDVYAQISRVCGLLHDELTG